MDFFLQKKAGSVMGDGKQDINFFKKENGQTDFKNILEKDIKY